MLNRGSSVRPGFSLLLLLLFASFLTISTTPTISLESAQQIEDDTAQLASFIDCTPILNSSTIGSLWDICIDSQGFLYVTGSTSYSSFPVVDGIDNTLGGTQDCFVMKMNTTDGSILYSSFLGGNSADYASSICVDSLGCIYVLGSTYSEDFPLVNPYSDYFNQSSQYFLTKFAPDGQTLVYSTFFGPEFIDKPNGADFQALAVDEQGYAYLAGSTRTSEVPIVNAFDDTYSGDTDCYVLKMNPTGTEVVYASFYGAQYTDSGSDLFYTDSGTIYVAGATDICPTDEYYYPGIDYGGHCFVLKISGNGTLLDSGEFKTRGFFPSMSIVVDSQYYVYLLDNFHTASSFAVYRLDDDLEDLEYTKEMGGSEFDSAGAFSIDSDDYIYIAGRTASDDFIQNPTNPYSGVDDCFIVRMNTAGGVVFSNLYGSAYHETTIAIAVGEGGQVYLAGYSVEGCPCDPGYHSSFIISIQTSSGDAIPLIQLSLVVGGTIGFVVLALATAYRKRSM